MCPGTPPPPPQGACLSSFPAVLAQGQQIQHHDENAHMTAILEIPLSAETQMRNIEATEAAKHQLLASPASSSGRWAQQAPLCAPEPCTLH